MNAATVDAHNADDTLTENDAGVRAVVACAPAEGPDQCTAAETAANKAWVAAFPCDGDGTTAATPDDTSDDCPWDTDSLSNECGMCLYLSNGDFDFEAGTAEEWTTAIEACEPTLKTADKASGTAGVVASLALAAVSAVAAQL